MDANLIQTVCVPFGGRSLFSGMLKRRLLMVKAQTPSSRQSFL